MSTATTYKALTTPVAFCIYRRPDTTRRVLDAIARAKPPLLYVIADGPRNAQEADLCAQTRAVIETIDWDCEVIKDYAPTNLGSKHRSSSGFRWLFNQVEEAIILEDDCVPEVSFFCFCQELLEYYRHNSSVMHIGGNCFIKPQDRGDSYYFSRFPHIWGWATWRRAWDLYDVNLESWNTTEGKKTFLGKFTRSSEKRFWAHKLDEVSTGTLDAWDYQWTYACIENDGLCVNPSVNLVSNIGFRSDATHTWDPESPVANLPVFPIMFPLKHPQNIQSDKSADEKTAQISFTLAAEPPPLIAVILHFVRRVRRRLMVFKQT